MVHYAVALQDAGDRHGRRGLFCRSLLRRRRLDPLHHTHADCACFIAKKALMSPAESAVKARILGNPPLRKVNAARTKGVPHDIWSLPRLGDSTAGGVAGRTLWGKFFILSPSGDRVGRLCSLLPRRSCGGGCRLSLSKPRSP